MPDISLTASLRANLESLQDTSKLMGRTQERLSTGRKVNNAFDDPLKFFTSESHLASAADLDRLKAGMGEAIQTLKAAEKGINGVLGLLEQARSLADSARSATTADKARIATQFTELVTQMKNLVADSTYRGTNLLNNQSLTVEFAEAHTMPLTGIDGSAGTDYLGGIQPTTTGYNDFATEADSAAAIDDLKTVISNFRRSAAELAGNAAIITTRQDFTTGMINTLKQGSAQLTQADENEESANMLMLQTRQQLGVTSMQISSQALQAILKLF